MTGNQWICEQRAVRRKVNIRCTIFTTEFDNRLDEQMEMEEIFKKAELKHPFIVTPNTGHWFPDDFDKKLDEAIEFHRR